MRQKQIPSLMLVLATTLVTAPGVLLAQAISPKAEATSPKSGTSKQVRVAVDYVDVTLAAYDKISRQIPGGQSHDALLLAALIKSGVQDTQAPRVQATDNVSANLDMATTVPVTTDGKAGSLSLHNFIEVKPHFNTDGMITVMMKVQRDVLTPGVTPPATTTTRFSATRTFQDGQTKIFGGLVSKKTLMAHLVFAKVRVISAP